MQLIFVLRCLQHWMFYFETAVDPQSPVAQELQQMQLEGPLAALFPHHTRLQKIWSPHGRPVRHLMLARLLNVKMLWQPACGQLQAPTCYSRRSNLQDTSVEIY